MTVVFQTTAVTAGEIKIPPVKGAMNYVKYDFHNDSIYECGITFGQSGGHDITGCDFFMEPFTELLEVVPPAGNKYTVGGNTFTGTIFVFFKLPGGGTIDASNAPAAEFTVVGYPFGVQSPVVIANNRMQNIGSSITVTNAPFLTNTGFAAGTNVISMTPVLDNPGSAAVLIKNNGVTTLGDSQNDATLTVTGRNQDSIQVSNDFITVFNNLGTALMAIGASGFSVLSLSTGLPLAILDSTGALKTFNAAGNNLVSIDNAGNVKIFDTAGHNRILMDTNGNLTFNNAAGTMIAEIRGDGIIFCDDYIPLSGDNLQLHDQSGTVQLKITTSGVTVSNALTLPLGSLTRVKSFTAAVTTVAAFFNHNLGVIPDIVLLQVQGGLSTARSVMYDPATMTTTQVSLIGTGSFNVIGLAIKF